MKSSFQPLLKKKIIALLSFLCIFSAVVFVFSSPFHESIRYLARYTARISAVIYLITMYHFVFNQSNDKFFDSLVLFATNHLIHFGFLAANVFLNNIALVPIKLLGGFLAYLLILFFPVYIKFRTVKSLM